MKVVAIFAVLLVLVIGGWWLIDPEFGHLRSLGLNLESNVTHDEPKPAQNVLNDSPAATSIVAEGLDTPWAIAFLPDKSMLVTERPGRVRFVSADGKLSSTAVGTLANAQEIGEGGLLGVAVHPQFDTNHFVYFYYTYDGSGNNTFNRVVRMTFENNQLSDEKTIVDTIPGASLHNGGRIKFGSDNLLYIGTGDAGDPSQAQDTNSLAGKILRVTDEGQPAPGNPFNNAVYSYGHRNVQGLAWNDQGQLWSTEHGRSGAQSGFDEVNLIESGKNYGWPDIQGDETQANMMTPIKHSGASTTWAPASAVFLQNSLFFTGLRGRTLYQAEVANNQITNFQEHFKEDLGRIREVVIGPDMMLYITTSNQDGRGNAQTGDDKIIKVDPAQL